MHTPPRFDGGMLTVIVGSMFSGKSDELIRHLRTAAHAGLNTLLFKPAIDNRYDDRRVITHDGIEMDAIPVVAPDDIINVYGALEADVIGIDEAQFMDEKIVVVVKKLLRAKKHVVVGGLSRDFRGEPFGSMPQLLALADTLITVYSICKKCKKKPGTRTQRIVNGKPASYNSPVVLVGGKESYEARCSECHEVPDLPELD